MNSDLQSIVALGIVGVAALLLCFGGRLRRKSRACGGGCACPTKKLPR